MEALAVRWLRPDSIIEITTPCLDCGESVRAVMGPAGLVWVDPPEAVGYQVSPFVQWREGSSAFN